MNRVLIFSLSFLAYALALPTDPYALGPTCGSTGKTCVASEGKCREGQCECWNPWGYEWGAGNFKCYEEEQKGCELKNDPELTTFDRESVNFPFPCRYLASHVRTQLRDKHDNVIGLCEAKVFGFNAKAAGKMYVAGFDVALKIIYSNNNVVESNYRRYGIANDNTNSVAETGKNGVFSPFVAHGTDDISYRDNPKGIRVETDWDQRDNRFSYKVTGCGVKVAFVPYDKTLKLGQRQIPGLAISVDNANTPVYLSPNKAICLLPGGDGLEDIKYDSLTIQRSMLLRAFKNQPTQLLPFARATNTQCTRIGAILSECQVARQKQAIRNCDWILKDVQFMKCYDNVPGSPRLIGLFRSCVEAWCDYRPCTDTINSIISSGCNNIGKVAHLSAFLIGNKCPPA